MRKALAFLVVVSALVVGTSAAERQFNKHSFLIVAASDTKPSGFEGVSAEVTVCDALGCETGSTNPKGAVNFRLPATDTSIQVTVIPIDAELCPKSVSMGLSGVVEDGFINHYLPLDDCDANTP